MKQGQVTIFVILGLLIVVSLAVFLLYSNLGGRGAALGEAKDITSLLPEFADSGQAIESCLDAVLLGGVTEIGLKGGYMDNAGLKKYDYAGLGVTYLYYDEQLLLPKRDQIAEDLAAYVKANALQCARIPADVAVVPGTLKDVNVYIRENTVDAEVEWPITFKRGDTSSRVEVMRATAPVRLGKIMDEITGFMAVQVEKPKEVCLSCLIDAGERNSFMIEVDNMITTYVFDIKDTAAKGAAYEFVFANGY
ncbi:MAG TPA: hypothetical protein HA362_01410 [Nanoarchaeota archaeon]|nr:hypothetical protein [Nanoarchaeota archaeon]